MNTKFKKYDQVKIVTSSRYYKENCSSNPRKVTGTIVNIENQKCLPIEVNWDNKTSNSYTSSDLVLVKRGKQMKPHIHAEVIKAWADGAEIEMASKSTNDTWIRVGTPDWDTTCQYRVKPHDPIMSSYLDFINSYIDPEDYEIFEAGWEAALKKQK
jgi:hypothetical protein